MIADVLRFFGNEIKANQVIQKEGLRLLSELKNEIVKHPEITRPMVQDVFNQKYDSNLNGLYWVLFPEIMTLAKGKIENIPHVLKNNKTARDTFEKNILTVTQEQFQESLNVSLQKPGEKPTDFSSKNQLFADINRGYSISFDFGNGHSIEVNPNHELDKSPAYFFESLKDQLKNLTHEEAQKIREFCQGFPSQGMFSSDHPFMPFLIQTSGDHHPTISVTFNQAGECRVNTKS